MDRLVQGGVLVPRDSLHLEVVMDNGNYSVKLTEYLASYHGLVWGSSRAFSRSMLPKPK